MNGKIEAIIGSPPERDELVVQLFVRNGVQWGEIFRVGDSFSIEIFTEGSLQFDAEEMSSSIKNAMTELKSRLEND